jgi:hypothetical protein
MTVNIMLNHDQYCLGKLMSIDPLSTTAKADGKLIGFSRPFCCSSIGVF